MHPVRTTLIASIAAAALLAGCSTKESRIEKGLEKAESFLRVADWDKAGVEARNVLQIDPKSARGHLIAGQVAEGQKDIRRAYGHFLKAVELQPAFPDAQVAVARLLLYTGSIDKAEETLRSVLAAEPEHVGARTIAAAVAARRGRVSEAMTEARALVEKDPAPVEAVMLLAGLYTNEGRNADALAVVEKALAAQPKNLGLLQVAAQIVANESKNPTASAKAAGYYRRAVEQAGKSFEVWKAWAAMHLQRDETDAAERVLREAIAAEPTDTARRTLLLEFLVARRGPEAAEKAYLAAIAEAPKEAALRFGLANLYRATNRPQDAQKVWQEVIATQADTPAALTARSELAAFKFAAGRVDEARTLVAEVLKASPRDNAALLLRGRPHLLDGRPQDAVVDLRSVVRDQPGSSEAVSLLARAHRAAGEPLLARDALAEAVKFKPEEPSLRLLLAGELVEGGQPESAIDELDAVIRLNPRYTAAYEAKARLAASRKDLAGAERALMDQKAAVPDLPIGHLQLGKFYADTRRPDLAMKEYDAGIARFPAEPSLYVAKVALFTGQKKFTDAAAFIERRQSGDAKNPLHEQLRGDVARARGDLAGATRAYEAMLALAPESTTGYLNLALVRALARDVPGAIAVLERGEAANPKDLLLPVTRAEYLGRSGRFDDAMRVYEKVLERQPDHDMAANNLAYLLAHVKRDPGSLDRALKLATRFEGSPNPNYLDSLGYVYFRRGEYAKAIPVLERARAMVPDSPVVSLNLGKALVKSGDAERGRTLIRRALDSKATLPDVDEAKALLAG